MIEFYEAATHVSIASNKNMTSRGWQACCRMIKRVRFFVIFNSWLMIHEFFFFFLMLRPSVWNGWTQLKLGYQSIVQLYWPEH